MRTLVGGSSYPGLKCCHSLGSKGTAFLSIVGLKLYSGQQEIPEKVCEWYPHQQKARFLMRVLISSGEFKRGLFFNPSTDIFGISLLISSMRSVLSLWISKISYTESMYLLRISQYSRSSVALMRSLLATSVLILCWPRRSLGLIFVKPILLLQDAIKLTIQVLEVFSRKIMGRCQDQTVTQQCMYSNVRIAFLWGLLEITEIQKNIYSFHIIILSQLQNLLFRQDKQKLSLIVCNSSKIIQKYLHNSS